MLGTLAVADVLGEPTELELDKTVGLVVDDDDGVNDVDNKVAGSTSRLDVGEVTMEEALKTLLELLWKDWLEAPLVVDEDSTVDTDKDSDVKPDNRSSELDEALVEDTLMVGSKVVFSAELAIADDMILEMLEDGSERLFELLLEGGLEPDMEDTLLVDSGVVAGVDDGWEVEVDESKSELEEELVGAALVLDRKVFGSTASVVLVEGALALVRDVLEVGSKVEELEDIELDDVDERSVDVDIEVESAAVGVVSTYTVPGCSSCG